MKKLKLRELMSFIRKSTLLITLNCLVITNSYALDSLDWACDLTTDPQDCLGQFQVVPKTEIPGDETEDNNEDNQLLDSSFDSDTTIDRPQTPGMSMPTVVSNEEQERPALNSNLIAMAAAAGALVIVFPNDRSIMDFVQENRNDVTEVAAYAGEMLGSDIPIAAAGVGYIVGLVMKNDKIKKTSLLLTKSLLITGLLVQGLKRVFHRERPSGDNSPYNFYGPSFSGDNLSFPSGHTITAFTFATFIAEYTKDKSRIIPVLAYSAAALAGWSRVHDEAHWASDVIMGALLGHLVTKMILSKHTKKSRVSISPYLAPNGGMMVGVSYTGKQFGGSTRYESDDEDDENPFGYLFNEFE